MQLHHIESIINPDLATRKIEIAQIILKCSAESALSLKSAILIIYSHWEGFIKKSAQAYLEFLSQKNIAIYELDTNFKAIQYRKNIKKCIDKLEAHHYLEFAKSFESFDDEIFFKLSIKNKKNESGEIIDAKGNLNTDRFVHLSQVIGFSYCTDFSSYYSPWIDNKFLRQRNAISHTGEWEDFTLDENEVIKIKNIILKLMDEFKLRIIEFIENEYYLKANLNAKNEFETSRNNELINYIKGLNKRKR